MGKGASLVRAAVMLASAGSSALAADLPTKKAPLAPPPQIFSWTGIYAGVNLGGSFGDSSGGGVTGGGQIGYNYQVSPLFVLGAEADIEGSSLHLPHSSIDYFGTVRGRAGFTPFDPRLLVYGTGGFAYAQVRYGTIPLTDNRTGFSAGGGVEWAFLPNWSAKVEYLYTDISTNDLVYNQVVYLTLHDTKFHTVRAGINYHFSIFPPAPALAAR